MDWCCSDADAVSVHRGDERAERKSKALDLLVYYFPTPRPYTKRMNFR